MRLLFICRNFAPDNVIGAVRITKLVKYLAADGHDVSVITSGIIWGKESSGTLSGLEKVKVYYYEGQDNIQKAIKNGIRKPLFPNSGEFMQFIKKVAHLFYDPIKFYYYEGLLIERKILKLYECNNEIGKYDVIISTFDPLGCVTAGNKIAFKEKSVYFIDLRDLMTNEVFTPILRWINSFTQKRYVKYAETVLCVSRGNTEILKKKTGENSKIITLYNGYDPQEMIQSLNFTKDDSIIGNERNKLIFCYTGTIHEEKKQNLRPLFRAISELRSNKKLEFVFLYAGKEGSIAKKQARECGVEDIVIDFGLVPKEKALEIQMSSDVFVVSIWNTTKDIGILTGKFYESLLCKKPVLGIVAGNAPDSELANLINKYKLGVCYEEADASESYRKIVKYIEEQSDYKRQDQKVKYEPVEEVFELFDYSSIAKKLSSIIAEKVEK